MPQADQCRRYLAGAGRERDDCALGGVAATPLARVSANPAAARAYALAVAGDELSDVGFEWRGEVGDGELFELTRSYGGTPQAGW